jgi:NADPH:quinone reductase
MKTVQFNELGNESVLKITDLPKPDPQKNQVLVEVKSAGINPVDVLITAGNYFRKPPLPYQPGFEGAGIVDSVGEQVTEFNSGDRVTFRQGSVGFGRVQGSFAQYVSCLPEDLIATPHVFTDDESGAFWLAGLTAWGGLMHLLNIQSGQTIAITAASGGVGHLAIQLAKAIGATVVATTRTQDKVRFIKSQGADHIVVTEEADLYDSLKSLGGIDHAFDAVGGDITLTLMKALKPNGRIVVYGAVSRKAPVIDFAALISKATGILGFTMMTLREDPHLLIKAEEELMSYIDKGKIKPHIGSRYPLVEAARAWRAIKDGTGLGKIVLNP